MNANIGKYQEKLKAGRLYKTIAMEYGDRVTTSR